MVHSDFSRNLTQFPLLTLILKWSHCKSVPHTQIITWSCRQWGIFKEGTPVAQHARRVALTLSGTEKKHDIRNKWVLILTCSGRSSAEEQQQTFIWEIWEVQREVAQYGHVSTASGVVPAAHLVLEKNLGWAQVSGKSLPRTTRAFPLKIKCVECCITWLFNGKDWGRQHSWKCCPSWGQNKVF